MAPTRELALQIHYEAEAVSLALAATQADEEEKNVEEASIDAAALKINTHTDAHDRRGVLIRHACLYGGTPKYHQARLLQSSPHVICATPGRLIDFVLV